ncbi:MerR family transcriptional regulator [Paenibacillus sp. CMAA1739]|uniref:MerR family transcriptional regulator n=1 Tax=Paenibacillus ottowii TaxID=2315729 RepID=UPI00273150B9|nr:MULTISPECIES: MerR family transcriptional regulator [Paenibacillus]MDP1513391.1 MerR family transcriptional regulator [Paenibacillus ottowii]MEC4569377.1 MerR family transcriptional regulator [Paenibacillus sp. CMAA1739]
MYTVKVVAKMLDLTEHTVRFYTDKGLVPDLQRDKNNNRVFDEQAINWLRGAKYLKKCGMSMEDIKKYVDLSLKGESTIEDRYEIIRKQKEVVLAQLEEAKIMAVYITNKEKHYCDIVKQVIPDNTNPSKWQSDMECDLTSATQNGTCPTAVIQVERAVEGI